MFALGLDVLWVVWLGLEFAFSHCLLCSWVSMGYKSSLVSSLIYDFVTVLCFLYIVLYMRENEYINK